jgi:hypothetical protein
VSTFSLPRLSFTTKYTGPPGIAEIITVAILVNGSAQTASILSSQHSKARILLRSEEGNQVAIERAHKSVSSVVGTTGIRHRISIWMRWTQNKSGLVKQLSLRCTAQVIQRDDHVNSKSRLYNTILYIVFKEIPLLNASYFVTCLFLQRLHFLA